MIIKLQSDYSTDEKEWQKVGPVLDASILSDEYATYDKKFGFTGAFVGICCQDLTGKRKAVTSIILSISAGIRNKEIRINQAPWFSLRGFFVGNK